MKHTKKKSTAETLATTVAGGYMEEVVTQCDGAEKNPVHTPCVERNAVKGRCAQVAPMLKAMRSSES